MCDGKPFVIASNLVTLFHCVCVGTCTPTGTVTDYTQHNWCLFIASTRVSLQVALQSLCMNMSQVCKCQSVFLKLIASLLCIALQFVNFHYTHTTHFTCLLWAPPSFTCTFLSLLPSQPPTFLSPAESTCSLPRSNICQNQGCGQVYIQEWHVHHDKLRSCAITENQFVCDLSLCCGQLTHLNREEIQKFVQQFRTGTYIQAYAWDWGWSWNIRQTRSHKNRTFQPWRSSWTLSLFYPGWKEGGEGEV